MLLESMLWEPLFIGTVSACRQPLVLNLASGTVVNCEYLRLECGLLQPHLTA